MRLLLVEDDSKIGEGLRQLLRRESYAVDWVRDGPAAETAARSTPYDLLLLDLGLPGLDGLKLLRSLRVHDADLAVIIITARDGLGTAWPGSTAAPTTPDQALRGRGARRPHPRGRARARGVAARN